MRPAVVADLPYTNYIFNKSADNIGLGVIHVRDGNYTLGTHDAVLPWGTFSDWQFGWTTTAGWYTGPGYCTQQWRLDNSGTGPRTRQLPDLGPGQHFIGAHTVYEVRAYRC